MPGSVEAKPPCPYDDPVVVIAGFIWVVEGVDRSCDAWGMRRIVLDDTLASPRLGHWLAGHEQAISAAGLARPGVAPAGCR